MDQETLDRLLIDRELGALPPDAAVLLAAYLERDERSARRAGEFGEAGDLARRALETEVPAVVPEFPRRVLFRDYVWRRRWRVVGQAAGLAACLLFGIWLGGAGSVTESGMTNATRPPLVVSDDRAAGSVSPTDDRGFWSAPRLYRDATASKSRTSKRFIWKSPVSKPKRGGAV